MNSSDFFKKLLSMIDDAMQSNPDDAQEMSKYFDIIELKYRNNSEIDAEARSIAKHVLTYG